MFHRFNGAALEPCKNCKKTSNIFCGSTLCPIDSMGQPLNLVKTAKAARSIFFGSTLCPIDSTGAPLNLVKTAKKQHVLCEHIMSYRFNGAALEPCKNCESSKQYVRWKHIMSHRCNGAALEPCKTSKKASNAFFGSTLCHIDSMGPRPWTL